MSLGLERDLVVAEAVSRLAVLRGGSADATTLEAYLEALSDLDPALVQAACRSLGLEPRKDYESVLPEVGKIRERVTLEARRRAVEADRLALPPASPPDRHEPTYRCALCWDEPAGWRCFACPDVPCARTVDHPPHHYAARCRCWLQRNRAQLEQRRQDLLTKNKPLPADVIALLDFDDNRYPWATHAGALRTDSGSRL